MKHAVQRLVRRRTVRVLEQLLARLRAPGDPEIAAAAGGVDPSWLCGRCKAPPPGSIIINEELTAALLLELRGYHTDAHRMVSMVADEDLHGAVSAFVADLGRLLRPELGRTRKNIPLYLQELLLMAAVSDE